MVQNAANENSEYYDCSGSYAETSRQYNRAASVNNQSVPSPTISPAHASPVMHHSTYVNQHIPAPMQQFPAENQSWLAYPAHQSVHAVHGPVHQADQFLQPEDLWRNQISTGAYTIYPTTHHMALQQQQQQFQHQRMMHEQQQQLQQQQQQQPQLQLQQHLAAQQAVSWSSETAPTAPASGSECSSVGTAAPSPTATGSGSEISGPPTPSTSAPSPTSMSSAPRSQQQQAGSGSSARSSNARSPFEWMRRPNYTAQSGKTRTKDKYRVVYSEHQRLELEKEFYSSRYITIRRKTDLAQCLDLSERQIKIWFQNRRAKERKQNKKREEMQRREMKPILDARGLTHPSPMLGLQARQPLSTSPPSSVGMMRHPAVAAPNAHVQPPIAAMASLNINMTNHHMLGMMQHHHFAAAAHHNAAMRAAACAANNGAQQPVAI